MGNLLVSTGGKYFSLNWWEIFFQLVGNLFFKWWEFFFLQLVGNLLVLDILLSFSLYLPFANEDYMVLMMLARGHFPEAVSAIRQNSPQPGLWRPEYA